MTTRFCAPDIHFLSAHCRSNFIEATTVQHHSLSLSLSHTHTHIMGTGTHTLSLSLSLSSAYPTRHTHTFKCTLTHITTHTHTLSHIFSLLYVRTNTHFFSFKPLSLSLSYFAGSKHLRLRFLVLWLVHNSNATSDAQTCELTPTREEPNKEYLG